MSSGLVQTPDWDGHKTYPPMISCVMLTRPADQVVFITFVFLDIGVLPANWQTTYQDKIVISPGPCWPDHDIKREYRRWDSNKTLFFPTDMAGHEGNNERLSFSFFSSEGEKHHGFRMRFSFHDPDLVPRRVEGGWNCSLAVWPDLHHHFPCDLRPQCADAEDEAKCFYTSKTCGPGKVISLLHHPISIVTTPSPLSSASVSLCHFRNSSCSVKLDVKLGLPFFTTRVAKSKIFMVSICISLCRIEKSEFVFNLPF